MDESSVAAKPLAPSPRLLYGPGPTNVASSVTDVVQRSMLSHLDPEFHDVLAEVVDMLRRVYRHQSGYTLPLSLPGTAGMEVGLVSLVDPGDTVVVGVAGFFGDRIVQAARRYGANVIEVREDPGNVVPNERIVNAVEQHPETALVAVVHAETSTGAWHPLAELAAALRDKDVLLMADCVTALGGVEVEPERWGIDFSFSCSQKCVGAPPGMSPITVSERALEQARRKRVAPPYSFDLEELANYYLQRPVKYHHTVPVLQLYALHEALRLALVEGMEARWQRHADAGAYLQDQLRGRGFELLADPAYQLPQLSAVRVPEHLDGPAVQRRLLKDFQIEVGGPLGAAGPSIWRIGLMGVNATRQAADQVLEALDTAIASEEGSVSRVASTAGSGQGV